MGGWISTIIVVLAIVGLGYLLFDFMKSGWGGDKDE